MFIKIIHAFYHNKTFQLSIYKGKNSQSNFHEDINKYKRKSKKISDLTTKIYKLYDII